VIAEGWFDIEKTKKIDPRVFNALEKGNKLELSTGLDTDNIPAAIGAAWNGRNYTHVARNYRPDHLAILPDQIGACSISDGCGVLVNQKKEKEDNKMVPISLLNNYKKPCDQCRHAKETGGKLCSECSSPAHNKLWHDVAGGASGGALAGAAGGATFGSVLGPPGTAAGAVGGAIAGGLSGGASGYLASKITKKLKRISAKPKLKKVTVPGVAGPATVNFQIAKKVGEVAKKIASVEEVKSLSKSAASAGSTVAKRYTKTAAGGKPVYDKVAKATRSRRARVTEPVVGNNIKAPLAINEWSDEARAASIEARRRKANFEESNTGHRPNYHAQMAAHYKQKAMQLRRGGLFRKPNEEEATFMDEQAAMHAKKNLDNDYNKKEAEFHRQVAIEARQLADKGSGSYAAKGLRTSGGALLGGLAGIGAGGVAGHVTGKFLGGAIGGGLGSSTAGFLGGAAGGTLGFAFGGPVGAALGAVAGSASGRVLGRAIGKSAVAQAAAKAFQKAAQAGASKIPTAVAPVITTVAPKPLGKAIGQRIGSDLGTIAGVPLGAVAGVSAGASFGYRSGEQMAREKHLYRAKQEDAATKYHEQLIGQ
jgi:hypothetical protein